MIHQNHKLSTSVKRKAFKKATHKVSDHCGRQELYNQELRPIEENKMRRNKHHYTLLITKKPLSIMKLHQIIECHAIFQYSLHPANIRTKINELQPNNYLNFEL
jgi:hypothetical protein